MYGYRDSFHIRAFSIAVIIGLCGYYAVLIFHGHYLIGLFRSVEFGWSWWPILLAVPVLMAKGGLVFRVYRRQRSSAKAIRAVALVSFYIFVFMAAIFTVLYAASSVQRLISSAYWKDAHLFWVGFFLSLVFAYSYLFFARRGLAKWQTVIDLKAVPIVSPIFCFGGPVLWSKNLAFASLHTDLIYLYSTLSIIAGVLFLVHLIVFGFINHTYSRKQQNEAMSGEILDMSGRALHVVSTPPRALVFLCCMLLAIGMFLFLSVAIDAVLMLLGAYPAFAQPVR